MIKILITAYYTLFSVMYILKKPRGLGVELSDKARTTQRKINVIANWNPQNFLLLFGYKK